MKCLAFNVTFLARCVLIAVLIFLHIPRVSAQAPAAPAENFYRLYEGITAYIHNPEGKDFSVGVDVRDLNLYANGPREVLFKIYDPDGNAVVREVIPDDGCSTPNMPDRIGGWDHELQCWIDVQAKGTTPWIRWSAWSDPARLATLVKRSFDRPIKTGGKKGVYRVVLAGTPDHYVSLRVSSNLSYGVCGHPGWSHGHGSMFKKTFIYVPEGTVGIFFAMAELDIPQTRRFKLSDPDGKVIYEGTPQGGYANPSDDAWRAATEPVAKGAWTGKLLTLEVSDAPGDYLVKLNLQQGKKGSFGEYVGMGSAAVFCPDEATARAIAGGTTTIDGEVYWHPFQVRFAKWLAAHKLDADEKQKALRKQLEAIHGNFRLLETSDGRGVATWANWAYAMGYYGCDIFRPGWLLCKNSDTPDDVKAIIREGLTIAGDRLSFAAGGEKVNGNAFSQINVALWYAAQATGDAMLKQRFETFWERWTTQGWGPGSGLSPSGDSQEHFAHDLHYGSYIIDNWRATGNTWVKGGGILGDAADDPRFQKVMDRYYELYSFIFCQDSGPKPGTLGGTIAACPWSARTQQSASTRTVPVWNTPESHPWKGLPGPDLTTDVNGGHEWFAARRPNYYFLTFHGRIAPEWISNCFQGQLGFGGGAICQLTIPGHGVVLASTLNDAYGRGMHPAEWRNFHIHTLAGERWDGYNVVAGITEHDDARLIGNTVAGSGEVRGAHIRAARSYTYNDDSIDCSLQLSESAYASALQLWGHSKYFAEMRLAYEMIPFVPKKKDGKTPTALTTEEGDPVTSETLTTKSVRIDRGGFGVDVKFEKPWPVKLGENHTLMIGIVEPAPKPTPIDRVAIKYKLVPFGGGPVEEPAPATKPDKPGKPKATPETQPKSQK